jgi:toxin FitB
LGALTARSQQQEEPLGNIDGLLAATAFEHRLTVVTHNTRHFEYLGVGVFGPWEN